MSFTPWELYEKHRPIPRGALQVGSRIAFVLASPVIYFGVSWHWAEVKGWNNFDGRGQLLGVIACFCWMITAVAAWFYRNPHGHLFADYWRRNVRGYWLRVQRTAPGTQYKVVSRNRWMHLRDCPIFGEDGVVLFLKLGGWFGRSRAMKWNPRLMYWQKVENLRLDFLAGERLRAVAPYGAVEDVRVRIAGKGTGADSCMLAIEHAVHYLSEWGTGGSYWSDVSSSITKFMDIAEALEQERIRHNELVAEAKRWQALAEMEETRATQITAVLIQTIHRLEATKRFVHSKEGRDLREWLREELITHVPPEGIREQILYPGQTSGG